MTFPKIYLGKPCQSFFLVISVNYCCCHHFSTKAILVKLKILNILMQWLKWFIFWMFLHCKLITSFLELFLATCFLCILQTQLTRRNCHHMMTKVTFVNFFIKTYSTLSIPYKISCKMDKNFLRYMFFLTPPARPVLSFSGRYFEKIPPKNITTCGRYVKSDLTKAKTFE